MLQMGCNIPRCSFNAMRSSLSFSLLILAALSSTAHAGDDGATKLQPGAALFQNLCAACHGPKGQGNEQLKTPSIAGEPAWYVQIQLGNFRAGRRGGNPAEPQAMVMSAITKNLTAAHLEALALHIEKLERIHPPMPTALKDADMAMGKELFEMRCMECHRFNASGEMNFGSPPLIGLQDWYLVAQIEKFKTGKRGAFLGDPNGAKMVLSSRFIEDEHAKRSVIAYILTLNPAAADAERLFEASAK